MIPKILHQMWIGPPAPEELLRWMARWKALHPSWEYRLWNEGNMIPLQNQDLWDRASSISPRAPEQFRSDVARYEILLAEGGVWVDADFEPLRPIDPLLDLPTFASKHEGRYVANGLIGVPPGHPAMAEAISRLPRSVQSRRGAHHSSNSHISGPRFFTPIAQRAGLHLLDEHLFLPYSYTELERGTESFPGSFAVHHWHNRRRQRQWPLGALKPQDPTSDPRNWPKASTGDPGRSIRVSVAVMAHPNRAGFVEELLTLLDRPPVVVWDQIQNRWDTGKRAMLAYDPEATHHLVIQDDALPCRDLVAGLEEALQVVPEDCPVGLYIGRVRPYGRLVSETVETAARGKAAWVNMEQINWGPGIVVPAPDIPEMIAYVEKRYSDANYDKRISRWFEDRGKLCWYPWPSLVEHRDSPSLVPNRGARRQAHTFLGLDVSALGRDWTGPVVTVPQRGVDRVRNNTRSTRRTRAQSQPGPNYRGL